MASSTAKLKRLIKRVSTTSQTISANSALELHLPVNVNSCNLFGVVGYQLYSINPATSSIDVRAVNIDHNNNVYVYLHNHESRDVTFYIAVDVLCMP